MGALCTPTPEHSAQRGLSNEVYSRDDWGSGGRKLHARGMEASGPRALQRGAAGGLSLCLLPPTSAPVNSASPTRLPLLR